MITAEETADLVERGYFSRQVSARELATHPNSAPVGSYIDLVGWVAARTDGEDSSVLIVSNRRPHTGALTSGWFTVSTPRRLPPDERASRGSLVHVQGRLLDSQYLPDTLRSVEYPRRQPSVKADVIEFFREGSGLPGLAGPLRREARAEDEMASVPCCKLASSRSAMRRCAAVRNGQITSAGTLEISAAATFLGGQPSPAADM